MCNPVFKLIFAVCSFSPLISPTTIGGNQLGTGELSIPYDRERLGDTRWHQLLKFKGPIEHYLDAQKHGKEVPIPKVHANRGIIDAWAPEYKDRLQDLHDIIGSNPLFHMDATGPLSANDHVNSYHRMGWAW